MALTHYPRIATDGLILYYDMNNTQKSWRGRPVTNLVSTNPLPNGTTTDYVRVGGTGSITYDSSAQAIKWVQTAYEPWGAYLYIGPSFNGNLSTSTQYTISFEWKTANSTVANSVYSYELVQGNGVSSAVSVSVINNSVLQENGWYLFKHTFTPANTGVDAYNRIILGTQSSAVSTFFWRKIQLEQNTFASAFTVGTRSSTQAILDYVGGNTLTANSLTYNSNGSFAFNGSSSTITTPLTTQLGNTSYTIEFILKVDSKTSNYGIMLWANSGPFNNGGKGIEIRYQNDLFEYTYADGTGAGTRLQYTFTDATANYYHIMLVQQARSTATLYVNGASVATQGYSADAAYSDTYTLTIGKGWDGFLNGRLPLFKLYNRDLSVAEVVNNYNALKARLIGNSQGNPAPSAAAIKAANPDVVSGIYWLYSDFINNGQPFQCYCDFTMDGGIGYAVYFQKYFDSGDSGLTGDAGYEPGPNFTSMSSDAVTGTAGPGNEFNIYPNLMPTAYNNGRGATRMIIFNRSNATSGTGIQNATYYKYTKITGISSTIMRDIWKSYSTQGQYSATFATTGNFGRTGGSGTVYITGSHGSSGGVYQWVSGSSSNINSNLVFEYKPVGYAEDNSRSDPNHYWLVGNGDVADTYFRANGEYGASGVLNIRWGGIAIY